MEQAKTGKYKKGMRTRDKILKISREMFYEQGCAGVSLADIARRAEIANGNLTYYFKKKNDIINTVILELLDRCDQQAREYLPEDAPSHFIACMGSFLLMLTVCRDPKVGRFVNDIYEDMDSRILISAYAERYSRSYFLQPFGTTKLSEKQVHSLAEAEAHAKFGILRDLLQRTSFAPSLDEIIAMSETGFLLTSRISNYYDEAALDAIQTCEMILAEHDYPGLTFLSDDENDREA